MTGLLHVGARLDYAVSRFDVNEYLGDAGNFQRVLDSGDTADNAGTGYDRPLDGNPVVKRLEIAWLLAQGDLDRGANEIDAGGKRIGIGGHKAARKTGRELADHGAVGGKFDVALRASVFDTESADSLFHHLAGRLLHRFGKLRGHRMTRLHKIGSALDNPVGYAGYGYFALIDDRVDRKLGPSMNSSMMSSPLGEAAWRT